MVFSSRFLTTLCLLALCAAAPILTRTSSAQTLLPLVSGDTSGQACGIDSSGNIVGSSGNKGILWTGSSYTITLLPSANGYAATRGNSVVTIGGVPKVSGRLFKRGLDLQQFRAFSYDGTSSVDINFSSGAGYNFDDGVYVGETGWGDIGGGIDSSGWVAGFSIVDHLTDDAWVYKPSPTNTLTKLPAMFVGGFDPTDRALGISNVHHVVGCSGQGGNDHASLWEYTSGAWASPVNLPPSSGDTFAIAHAISAGTSLNDSVIVGYSGHVISAVAYVYPVYWTKVGGIWTPTALSSSQGIALCVTDDGNVIGGYLGTGSGKVACTWRRTGPGFAYTATSMSSSYATIQGVRDVSGTVKGVGVTSGSPAVPFITNVP